MVRVFSLPKGEKLYTFKRGIQVVQIYSLTFSMSSTYITVSSNSGTIHIFKLSGNSENSTEYYTFLKLLVVNQRQYQIG